MVPVLINSTKLREICPFLFKNKEAYRSYWILTPTLPLPVGLKLMIVSPHWQFTVEFLESVWGEACSYPSVTIHRLSFLLVFCEQILLFFFL